MGFNQVKQVMANLVGLQIEGNLIAADLTADQKQGILSIILLS